MKTRPSAGRTQAFLLLYPRGELSHGVFLQLAVLRTLTVLGHHHASLSSRVHRRTLPYIRLYLLLFLTPTFP